MRAQLAEIAEYMSRNIPDSRFVGGGADGCVFALSDKHVVKVLYQLPNLGIRDGINYPRIEEALAIKIMNEHECALAPDVFAVGNIIGYKAFVRENLKDINGALDDIVEGSFGNLVLDICNQDIIIRDITDAEDVVTDFLSNRYIGDDVEHEACSNPVLQAEVLLGIADAGHKMKSMGIKMSDIFVGNLGMDAQGVLKFRDLSRFEIPKSIEALDYSNDMHDMLIGIQMHSESYEPLFKREDYYTHGNTFAMEF